MKGVTHYFFAAALVSLIPMVMQLSVYEKAFIIVLGAVAGILPDYIDFKIVKYLWRIDEEITPEWPIPDARRISEKIAQVIDEAWEKKRIINVQIHTIKTGPNTWRRWYIHLNPETKKVVVGIGPIQTFSGREFSNTVEDIPPEKRKGEASFNASLKYDYKDRTIKISILSGPTVAFVPRDDHVEVVFLPWHRCCSHSFTMGAVLSLLVIGFSLIFLQSLTHSLINGLAFFVGYASHIISDQLGFMGSNLLWPITKNRTPGFKLAESMDPYANFILFWLSITTLFWQMNASIPNPISFPLTIAVGSILIPVSYVLIVIIPIVLAVLLRKKFWKSHEDPYLKNLLSEELYSM